MAVHGRVVKKVERGVNLKPKEKQPWTQKDALSHLSKCYSSVRNFKQLDSQNLLYIRGGSPSAI